LVDLSNLSSGGGTWCQFYVAARSIMAKVGPLCAFFW
jgi:hypothetical protein